MFSHDPNVGTSHSQLNPLGSLTDNRKSCQCSESSSGEHKLSLCLSLFSNYKESGESAIHSSCSALTVKRHKGGIQFLTSGRNFAFPTSSFYATHDFLNNMTTDKLKAECISQILTNSESLGAKIQQGP